MNAMKSQGKYFTIKIFHHQVIKKRKRTIALGNICDHFFIKLHAKTLRVCFSNKQNRPLKRLRQLFEGILERERERERERDKNHADFIRRDFFVSFFYY
jgi:hypothetical protein